MKYRIADNIVFDTESDWIVQHEGDSVLEEKKLTKTAAQILTILLSSYGELVERDFLLSEVWESRGHHGSNSSLNQYISIIRKTLYEMGVPKDCIVSEPKKGFIFSRAIAVTEIVSQDLPHQEEHSSVSGSYPVILHPDRNSSFTKKLRDNRSQAINIMLWALVVISMLACFYELNKVSGVAGNHETVKIFTLKKCDVLSDTTKYASYQQIMQDIIYDLHPDIEKQCASGNMSIFIRVQPSVYFGHVGRVFLALCAAKPGSNDFAYCENNYRYNYLYRRSNG